jgi:hypothetical protein
MPESKADLLIIITRSSGIWQMSQLCINEGVENITTDPAISFSSKENLLQVKF